MCRASLQTNSLLDRNGGHMRYTALGLLVLAAACGGGGRDETSTPTDATDGSTVAAGGTTQTSDGTPTTSVSELRRPARQSTMTYPLTMNQIVQPSNSSPTTRLHPRQLRPRSHRRGKRPKEPAGGWRRLGCSLECYSRNGHMLWTLAAYGSGPLSARSDIGRQRVRFMA